MELISRSLTLILRDKENLQEVVSTVSVTLATLQGGGFSVEDECIRIIVQYSTSFA